MNSKQEQKALDDLLHKTLKAPFDEKDKVFLDDEYPMLKPVRIHHTTQDTDTPSIKLAAIDGVLKHYKSITSEHRWKLAPRLFKRFDSGSDIVVFCSQETLKECWPEIVDTIFTSSFLDNVRRYYHSCMYLSRKRRNEYKL